MKPSKNKSTDTSASIAASPRSGARLRKLFFETLYLSAFTFGGGYVIVSLLKKKFVDDLHWISEDEMLDLVAIAQSAPGPIAVNGAIVVGYKLCGFPGILFSVLGAIIPPFLMLSVISLFYSAFRSNFMIHHMLSGMRCGVSAVIMSVTWDMASGVLIEKPKHPRTMQVTESTSSSASVASTTTSDVATAAAAPRDTATANAEKAPSIVFHWSSLVIMIAAFVANYRLGISTIWIILAVIALGVAVTLGQTHLMPATTTSAIATAADQHMQMAAPNMPTSAAADSDRTAAAEFSDSARHTSTEEVKP